MAKPEAKNKEIKEIAPDTKPPKAKKGKRVIIFIIIIVILGGIIFIFRNPIKNFLSGVPVIGNLFTAEEAKLPYDELESKLTSSELELATLQSKVTAYESEIKALEDKIETLEQYEANYSNFLAQKEAWDESVAETNQDLFIEQFEATYPETAEKIYSELKGESFISAEQKAYASTIGQMDSEQAAKALEMLLSSDPELVQIIFNNLGKEQKAAILDNMTSESAAQTMKLISPDINE